LTRAGKVLVGEWVKSDIQDCYEVTGLSKRGERTE
jgi:hypothetical protein